MTRARGSKSSSPSPRDYSPAPVLVGSSLGGHVSAAAAARCSRAALFLLAPAFYMPGFEAYTPQDVACPTAIVHGWHDDIVPVENSIRWAREHGAAAPARFGSPPGRSHRRDLRAAAGGFLAELAGVRLSVTPRRRMTRLGKRGDPRCGGAGGARPGPSS